MTRRFRPLLASAALLMAGACAVSDKSVDTLRPVPVVRTVADVTVSDGSQFVAIAGHGPTGSFYREIYADRTMEYSTDGQSAVFEQDGEKQALHEDYVLHVLRHQFHTQVLEFRELNYGIAGYRDCSTEVTECEERLGSRGAGKLGIQRLALQVEPRTQKPHSLITYRGREAPIVATYGDWRVVDGISTAYRVTVDDGERTFDYRYRSIEGL